jgi:hypothetical protein
MAETVSSDLRRPRASRVIDATLMALLGVWVLVAVTRSYWIPTSPSPSHPYGVKFRGPHTYYFPAWFGYFVQYFLVAYFAAFALSWYLTYRYRRSLRGNGAA